MSTRIYPGDRRLATLHLDRVHSLLGLPPVPGAADIRARARRPLGALDAAMDEGEERDLDGAYRHMYKAMDHLADARDGKIEFDEDVFGGHVGRMNECLNSGAEDESLEGAVSQTEVARRVSPTSVGGADSALRRSRRAMDEASDHDCHSIFQTERS